MPKSRRIRRRERGRSAGCPHRGRRHLLVDAGWNLMWFFSIKRRALHSAWLNPRPYSARCCASCATASIPRPRRSPISASAAGRTAEASW